MNCCIQSVGRSSTHISEFKINSPYCILCVKNFIDFLEPKFLRTRSWTVVLEMSLRSILRLFPPSSTKFPSRYDRRTNPRKRPKIVHRLFRSLIRNTFSCPWQHAVFHRSQWMRSSRISSVFYSKFVALWVLCKFIICEKGVFLYYLSSDSWHTKISVY